MFRWLHRRRLRRIRQHLNNYLATPESIRAGQGFVEWAIGRGVVVTLFDIVALDRQEDGPASPRLSVAGPNE